jgi:hypothetical protein
LFGDKGYLSAKTTAELLKRGPHLVTKVRQNMKPKPTSEANKFLLRRRGIIDTIFGQLNPDPKLTTSPTFYDGLIIRANFYQKDEVK